MKLGLTVLFIALCACQSATAPGRELHPVTAQLIADAASVQPGQAFTVGVILTMKPCWHVYWKNPGDAGTPVAITISGPPGLGQGAVGWPLPISFQQPGDIAGFGYTDTVLFPVTLTAPKDVATGATLQIAADVKWLCCKDVCMPGSAKLELALPVGDPRPANTETFAAWRDRLPVADPDPLAIAEVAGAIDRATRRGSFVVTVAWKKPPARVEFFPEADPALDISNVAIASEGGRSRITFDARVFEGQRLAANDVGALVVATNERGERRGLTIQVPLQREP